MVNQDSRDLSKITVVGLGNMGGSLVNGLLKSKALSQLSLQIFDLHDSHAEKFSKVENCRILGSLGELKNYKGVLLLCVKPHDLEGLAFTLKGKINESSLILSILAGVTLNEVEETLDFKGAVVRAMPNIAATIGEAATAMSVNSVCNENHKRLAESIFQAVGEAFWVKESLMDTVTGLSGSGPAYIYMVIEALTDGGVKMGLPRALARNLATQTVLGAAALVKETGEHPAILKDQVTTPAGTTISALHELEERGLRSMFVSAVEIATNKSKNLGNVK